MVTNEKLLLLNKVTTPMETDNLVLYKTDSIIFQVEGTFSGATLFVEGKLSDEITEYVPVAVTDLKDMSINSTGIKTKGLFQLSTHGLTNFRLRLTGITAGQMTVTGIASSYIA